MGRLSTTECTYLPTYLSYFHDKFLSGVSPHLPANSNPHIPIGSPSILLNFFRCLYSLTSHPVRMACYLPSPMHFFHYNHSDTQSASLHAFVCAVTKLRTSVSALRNDFNKRNKFPERHRRSTSRPSFSKTYFHNVAAPNRSTNYGRLDNGPSSNRVPNRWCVGVGHVMHRLWILDIGSIVHRNTASLSHASLYRNLVNGPTVIHDECSYFDMAPNRSIRYERLDIGPTPNRVLNCWISDDGYATHCGTASMTITSEERSPVSKVWSLDIGFMAQSVYRLTRFTRIMDLMIFAMSVPTLLRVMFPLAVPFPPFS